MRLKNFCFILTILCSSSAFAAESTAKPGMASASEMIVEDIIEGRGPAAGSGSRIMVYYAISAEDGKIVQEKTPFTYRIGSGVVLSLWNEGVQGMKVGGRRMITVDSKQIGLTALGSSVSSTAKLIYEIELVNLESGNIADANKKAKSN